MLLLLKLSTTSNCKYSWIFIKYLCRIYRITINLHAMTFDPHTMIFDLHTMTFDLHTMTFDLHTMTFDLQEGYAAVVSDWTRIYFMVIYICLMVVMTIVVAFVLEAFLFRIQYRARMHGHDLDGTSPNLRSFKKR